MTIKVPVDGQVLQLKVSVEKFVFEAAAGAGQPTWVLLVRISPLHVRVDVDAYDKWRFPFGASARGYF
jgi:hypothetical protein